MSNRIRIDITRWLEQVYEKEKPDERHEHQDYLDDLKTLLYELKRCYELIDAAEGNVPYVEHCEECGATDGGDAEGCDYCGIIHYESKPRGFYHKDSPKR